MFTFLVIVTIILFIALELVTAMRPKPSLESMSELKRRATRSRRAEVQLVRELALADILAVQRIVTAVLLVGVVCLFIVTFGWFIGVLTAFFVALFYGSIASWRLVAEFADFLYRKCEPWLIRATGKASIVFRFLRGTPLYDTELYRRIDSRDELVRLIEKAGDVFSDQEKALLSHTLVFQTVRVSAVMTRRSDIKSIEASEFLGPLVLSELHDTGHSRLPVTNGDLDHIIGMLYLHDLLSLDTKRSTTAEKAMEKKVYYVHEDDTLEHALGAFLKTHHHLFVVINDARETVGLLSLENVMEMLLGRQIIDEDDIHTNKEAVASRIHNNSAPGHIDI